MLLEGSWGVFELDVARLMAPLPERILYDDVISYPAARQDIAIVVPEDVEAGAIVAAAHDAAGDELREARIFDVYRGAQVGRGGSPSRSTSRSRRRTGRSPTKRPRPSASGSSRRSPSGSGRAARLVEDLAADVPDGALRGDVVRLGERAEHRDGAADVFLVELLEAPPGHAGRHAVAGRPSAAERESGPRDRRAWG